MARLVVLALVSSLALVACGESDEQKVRRSANELIEAIRHRDVDAFCARVSEKTERALREGVDEPSCEAAATLGARFLLAVSDPREWRITKVAVVGDHATVSVDTGSQVSSNYGMLKVDGEWLLDDDWSTACASCSVEEART